MGWMGENVILARYKFHFCRVHDNLMNDQSNNKFILIIVLFKIAIFPYRLEIDQYPVD